MDAETVNKLLEINRAFYSQFSTDFSDSRSSEHLNIVPFRKYLADGTRVLDAGCGNGRLAETMEHAGYTLDYVGVDGSADLITVADRRRGNLKNVRAGFSVADFTTPGWSSALSNAAPFDLIVSLAVLHHIPSFELRANVLHEIHSVLKPNGIFVMSNWQFIKSERLRKKIIDWESVGVETGKLESDDYLLDWQRGGIGYRYVHLLTESEIQKLAQETNFQIIDQFSADNDLNLFSILQSPITNL